MSVLRAEAIQRLLDERARHLDMPGSEWDAHNTPSDWVAIASHYLNNEVRRAGLLPDRESFEGSLIKAAAVILAALEHADVMEKQGCFR